MRSTLSLPSLLDPLWLEVVAPGRILSINQIELCANKWQLLNCDLYYNTWNRVQRAYARLRKFPTNIANEEIVLPLVYMQGSSYESSSR